MKAQRKMDKLSLFGSVFVIAGNTRWLQGKTYEKVKPNRVVAFEKNFDKRIKIHPMGKSVLLILLGQT
jgi:hypothetical protein